MRRLVVVGWVCALLSARCASSTPDAEIALRQDCEKNMQHDTRCLELLTSDSEGYESREQVMAAEEDRKARAFSDRLARMRRDEEARQLERIKTQSSSVAASMDLDPLDAERMIDQEWTGDEPPLETSPPGGEARVEPVAAVTPEVTAEEEVPTEADDEDDSETSASDDLVGSSVRALTAAPKPGGPKIANTAPAPVQPASFAAPTPEEYMRGSLCLMRPDLAELKQALSSAKKAGGQNPGLLGAAALVIVDGEAVVERVAAEMKHRGIAENGPEAECTTPSNRSMVLLLRRLVGPGARRVADADRYGKGLTRLRKELELRAGLPRAD